MNHRQYISKQFELASTRYREEINIFLAGPFIKPSEPMPEGEGITPAHKARYSLFHRINRDEGISPSLGEHKDLLEVGTSAFKALSNAHVAELLIAKDHCDAIIILPSSPGSFCEIGLFANYEEICRKMLIIVDERFKDAESYFSLGPLKEAGSNYSEIEFCDYENIDKMWEISSTFIEKIRNKKMIARMKAAR
ncbi:hypothetical protein [Azospirillum largimobile]